MLAAGGGGGGGCNYGGRGRGIGGRLGHAMATSPLYAAKLDRSIVQSGVRGWEHRAPDCKWAHIIICKKTTG